MRHFLISISNELAKASYDLSITEVRLLLYLISEIHPDEEIKSTEQYKLDIRKLSNLLEKKEFHVLAEVKKAIKELHLRTLYIKKEEGFHNQAYKWLSKEAELIDDNYTLVINWSKEIIPHISSLNSRFTKVTLGTAVSLKSVYAIKIYFFIKCEKGFKPKVTPYISVEDLRFMLALPDNKHTSISNLNNNVIKPAIKAINSSADISIEVNSHKKERKTIGFKFVVGRKQI